MLILSKTFKVLPYKKYHLTEITFIKIINDICSAVNKMKIIFLTLFNFSSAFDASSHTILMYRFSPYFNINFTKLNWLTSYLATCHQSVSIFGSSSPVAAMVHDVPKGSVLGQMLFICTVVNCSSW